MPPQGRSSRDRPGVALPRLAAARVEYRHVVRGSASNRRRTGAARSAGSRAGAAPPARSRGLPCEPVGEDRAADPDPLARQDLRLPVQRQVIGVARYQDVRDGRLGRLPPSTRRAGAGACRTTPGQARQASFGRLVTRVRNWAGITSSRLAVSLPISPSGPWRQGQVVASGASTCLISGRCAGRPPRPARRRCFCCSRAAGDRLPASAAFSASVASISSKANCSCSSVSRSDFRPNCRRCSFSSRWRGARSARPARRAQRSRCCIWMPARRPCPTPRAAAPAVLRDPPAVSAEWVGAQLGSRQRSQGVRTAAEVHRLGRQQDPHAGQQRDHAAEVRIARSTVVSRASSVLGATRSTAPASFTSTEDNWRTGAAVASGAGAGGLVTTGTKLGSAVVVALTSARRACRRQSKTCCWLTCQRRATSVTLAPGSAVSATILAFSSSDQLRRRPGPVRTSARRYPTSFVVVSAIHNVVQRLPAPDRPSTFTPAKERRAQNGRLR